MQEEQQSLVQFLSMLDEQVETVTSHLPTISEVHYFLDELLTLLFPNCSKHSMPASRRCEELMSQLTAMLQPVMENRTGVVSQFFAKLPELHRQMMADAEATLAVDPAAQSLSEIIVSYPGFYATAIYRLAHQLASLEVPILPRMLTEYAHRQTGIDIHPCAKIGSSFVIDHGTGIVIGATAHIGNHVTIYHGVTLGALQVKKSAAHTKRHPTVEDHVTIYANATVLGGKTTIGHHSVIGGNTWVSKSVLPHSLLYFDGSATVEKSKLASKSPAKKFIRELNMILRLIKQYQQIFSSLINQSRSTRLLDDVV